jgi:hypothetical protein
MAGPVNAHGLVSVNAMVKGQAVEPSRVGFHEDDGRIGRHHVGPFHVQRLFIFPVSFWVSWPCRICPWKVVRITVLIHFDKGGWIGQAKLLVELMQVIGDGGVIVGVNNGNGLPAAVGRDIVAIRLERDLINAISVPDLYGSQRAARRSRAGQQDARFQGLELGPHAGPDLPPPGFSQAVPPVSTET